MKSLTPDAQDAPCAMTALPGLFNVWQNHTRRSTLAPQEKFPELAKYSSSKHDVCIIEALKVWISGVLSRGSLTGSLRRHKLKDHVGDALIQVLGNFDSLLLDPAVVRISHIFQQAGNPFGVPLQHLLQGLQVHCTIMYGSRHFLKPLLLKE